MDAGKLFNKIARSHMYWGRKPLMDLLPLFEDSKGQVILDPFCGAGTPAVAALIKGARIIATDLNPISTFLTRVLIRPLNIPGVVTAFDEIYSEVLRRIGDVYKLPCPFCGKSATLDYVLWQDDKARSIPFSAKAECRSCGRSGLRQLPGDERKHQLQISQMEPVA